MTEIVLLKVIDYNVNMVQVWGITHVHLKDFCVHVQSQSHIY